MGKNHQKSGFGLLEVVFSTAIFIVVVGSMVALGRLSLRNAVLSTHRAQAVNLSQEGLEMIRQMRDTAWITRTRNQARGDESVDWLSYVKCNVTEIETYEQVTPGNLYTLGSDQYYQNFGQICLVKAETGHTFNDTGVIDASSVTLRNAPPANQPDPGAPPSFKRMISFERVPNTNEACSQTVTDYFGLQLLAPNNQVTGGLCTLPNLEANHAVKVVSTVKWRDFDKDWSVAVSTLLTNWRSK